MFSNLDSLGDAQKANTPFTPLNLLSGCVLKAGYQCAAFSILKAATDEAVQNREQTARGVS